MNQIFDTLNSYLASNTSLNLEEIGEIVSFFKYKKIKRKELLERNGQVCNYLYFVKKGCLRLYEIDKKGNEVTGYFALEDSIITVLPSFVLQKPSIGFLEAFEPSEILSIHRNDFNQLRAKFSSLEKIYHNFIEFAAIHTQMRIYSFLGMEGIDKLRWVMEHEPKLLLRVSSKAVASYLGMTNSTLSKLKAKL